MNAFIKREYDYAIRICAYLSGHYQKRAIGLAKISKVLSISRPIAGKVSSILTEKCIINTIQGRSGGIALNVNPANLSVYDVLIAMGFNARMNA